MSITTTTEHRECWRCGWRFRVHVESDRSFCSDECERLASEVSES